MTDTERGQSSDPDEMGYIDARTVHAAQDAGLDPHALDWHVEAVHGWEAHDGGFVERGLAGAVTCLLGGGCETTPASPFSPEAP